MRDIFLNFLFASIVFVIVKTTIYCYDTEIYSKDDVCPNHYVFGSSTLMCTLHKRPRLESNITHTVGQNKYEKKKNEPEIL